MIDSLSRINCNKIKSLIAKKHYILPIPCQIDKTLALLAIIRELNKSSKHINTLNGLFSHV